MSSSSRGKNNKTERRYAQPRNTANGTRKFPQLQQSDIFGLSDAFRKLDVDDKGYIDETTAIKATQASERQPYDAVRAALKEVGLDASRRVELEDYVGVCPSHFLQAPPATAERGHITGVASRITRSIEEIWLTILTL